MEIGELALTPTSCLRASSPAHGGVVLRLKALNRALWEGDQVTGRSISGGGRANVGVHHPQSPIPKGVSSVKQNVK